LKYRNEKQEVWMNLTLAQIAAQIAPRTWVEQVAIDAGHTTLKYRGGLGNPLRPANPTVRMVRNAVSLASNANNYGRDGGMPQVIDATIDFSQEVDGITLKPENIAINETGSCAFLGYLATAMAKKKKKSPFLDESGNLQVLIVSPAYISVLPKRDVGHHLFDPWANVRTGASFAKALEDEIIRTGAKLVVLSSVYNPTTRVMKRSEMEEAVAVCKKYGCVLFMDDAYRHIYRNRRGPISSVLTVPGAMDGLVCATLTASKGHQSPCKGASIVGHPEVIEMIRSIRKDNGEGGDIPTQIAWGALLLEPEYLKKTRTLYDQHFQHLVKTWGSAGWIELQESDASIFIYAPVPRPLLEIGWTSNHFVQALAQAGIIFYPTHDFFPGSVGEFVRICAGGNNSNIDQAAEVIYDLLRDPPEISAAWPQVRG
jgi:aspartate/methionine/tyrosine aminotransferase